MDVLTVNVDGKEITYGAYTQRSNFSQKEWLAICNALLKEIDHEAYEMYKDQQDIVLICGTAIDLSNRYEALLELLPQTKYSKDGTHPSWVAEEVAKNTYDKLCVKTDMQNLVNDERLDIDSLRSFLIEYFDLEKSKLQNDV